jgi:23S rRNA (adenine2503-C2)-methyltransferase
MKEDIKKIGRAGLESILSSRGEAVWRVEEIFRWIYLRGARSFGEMTSLPKELRAALAGEYEIREPEVAERLQSADGTEKLLLRLDDGAAAETVIMPGRTHFTQCLSSQSGCALACSFCHTGKMGFVRNLTGSEIADQWLSARRLLGEGDRIGNLVYMGMGEPLLNFDALRESVEIFTAPWGGAISPSRINVSTAGVIPGIERLGRELPAVNLAVSLNASEDSLRSRLMPINRRYPLADLMAALRDYPVGRRRITIEYVLLGGVNDSPEAAGRLVGLLHGLHCKVNLIPFNPHSGLPFAAPAEESIKGFHETLKKAGFAAPVRRSKGTDITAACGQLGGHRFRKSSAPP